MYELHGQPDEEFIDTFRMFKEIGCSAVNMGHCDPPCATEEELEMIREIYSWCGDDVDAAVADLHLVTWGIPD